MTNEALTPDPQSPESDAFRSLYYLSHVNPEAGIEHLRGTNLAEFAVMGMEEAGLEIADEYRRRLLERKIEDMHALIAEGTYTSLTEAVYLAAEQLRLEDLSYAWFSREEYEIAREAAVNDGTLVTFEDVERHLTDEVDICAKYTDPDEFRIAFRLASNGFEGTDKALTEFYAYRLGMIRDATRDTSTYTTFMKLSTSFTRFEHKEFVNGAIPEHKILFYAQDWLFNAMKLSKGLSEGAREQLESQTAAFYEDIISASVANKLGSTRNNVLSTRLVKELLLQYPENEQYLKWKKQLSRHFKFHQYRLISPVYASGDIEYALHNLREPTINDVVAVMSSHVVENSTR